MSLERPVLCSNLSLPTHPLCLYSSFKQEATNSIPKDLHHRYQYELEIPRKQTVMSLKLFDIAQAWDPVEAVTPEIEARRAFATSFGVLYQGDCLELLPYIRREAVDTIFADPPFNLSKEYDVVLDPFGGRWTTCVHMN
jgi:hypothetical protein